MADGSERQAGFRWRSPATTTHGLRPGEITVDLFAGGGGASEAMEMVTGRPVDVAINHDRDAVGLHALNHPFTRHLCEDVYEADPIKECSGRRIGWLHASPDCTEHSQAKGGQPRNTARRALSWVVLKWVGQLAKHGLSPRMITLENVSQILKWGPCVAKRDVATGRVVTLDTVVDAVSGKKTHRVANVGERVPRDRQYLVPDKRHIGRTWKRFVELLRAHGYDVQWRLLTACDFEDSAGIGAGTRRTRLFMCARADGLPVAFPEPSRGDGDGLKPYVTAADCIDWSTPCPSIFMTKSNAAAYTKSTGLRVNRPLADQTLRRVARGIVKHVLQSGSPFIVPNNTNNLAKPVSEPTPTATTGGRNMLVAPTLLPVTHVGSDRIIDPRLPLPVITSAHRGELAIASAQLVQMAHSEGAALTKPQGRSAPTRGAPLSVVPTGNACDITAAYLEQANSGFYDGSGHDARAPMSAITGTGSQQQVVSAYMAKLRGACHSVSMKDPVATVSAGGTHHAVVECTLSPAREASALSVAKFLLKYHDSLATEATAKRGRRAWTKAELLALVTITVGDVPCAIVDIGLRMLAPRELFTAQGFRPSYIIDQTADGRRLPKSASIRMVGNSVSPQPLYALGAANLIGQVVQEPVPVAA